MCKGTENKAAISEDDACIIEGACKDEGLKKVDVQGKEVE